MTKSGMVQEMFDNVVGQIRALINDQIRKVKEKENKAPVAVVLVGGFSSCQYLFNILKEEHEGHLKIFKSNGTKPWSAICRGAVFKALINSDLPGVKVSSRISRLNYGTVFRTRFIEGTHHDEDRIWDPITRVYKASNQIDWHLKRGDDIWDHDPVTVGRHRMIPSNEIGADGNYTWREKIFVSDLTAPPKRKTEDTKQLAEIKAEVNVLSLQEQRNSQGMMYRSLHFKIEMNVCGSGLEFSILFGGKRIAAKNVDVEFNAQPTAASAAANATLSPLSRSTSGSPQTTVSSPISPNAPLSPPTTGLSSVIAPPRQLSSYASRAPSTTPTYRAGTPAASAGSTYPPLVSRPKSPAGRERKGYGE
jgi:hypothetical protein